MSAVEATQTPLTRELAARIAAQGPIPFSEYMEACLYHPGFGYYSRAENAKRASYYTSPEVHPIFGRLLARQLHEMWTHLGSPQSFQIVELGAGAGSLAAQILDFCVVTFPEFYRALQYSAVERSAVRRAGLDETLKPHVTRGHADIRGALPAHVDCGCVLSNEFFDTLPVHRVLQADSLRELFVALQNGVFVEVEHDLSSRTIADYLHEQGITLAERQQAEVCLEACDWAHRIGSNLKRGYVITIDYGHPARELYNERHMRGTLLAYGNHRAAENYFDSPGEQDLTAHVNFTALDLAGRDAGLISEGIVSQTNFLLALGHKNEFADLYERGASELERIRARLKLKTLLHPEALGETFQVFIQRKNVQAAPLTGLAAAASL